MTPLTRIALAVTIGLLTTSAFADDLTSSDRLLCSAGTVVACSEDGECFHGLPTDYNIPQFLEVDLQKKRMSTTKSSGENRATDFTSLKRQDGRIVIQGAERGRAFSLMINEKLGMLTASVAVDGFSIAVFGACTPMTESK